MRAILTILTFIVCSAGQAKDLLWHRGSVVLATNEVVVGDIARQGLELVLLRSSEGSVLVYPAHKVSSFRFYDKDADINRMFVAIAGKYYERVVNGSISVFRIQKTFNDVIDESNADGYDYYIEKSRKVCSLKNFRRKYFETINDELNLRLVPHKHLDPSTNYGAVSLIILYNKSLSALI